MSGRIITNLCLFGAYIPSEYYMNPGEAVKCVMWKDEEDEENGWWCGGGGGG